MTTPSDIETQLCNIFERGAACHRRGGYLADNPHEWGSEPWQAWREGFNYAKREPERRDEQRRI